VSATIRVEVHGRTHLLVFQRPEVRNAWSEQMHREYLDALDAAMADPGVSAVVVTGGPDAFSAGADFARLEESVRHGWRPYDDPRPLHHPLGLPKPIIACVNGPAVGLGLVQAAFCDLRVVSEGARFDAAFPRLGLVAEHGLAWLLPRLIGTSVAMQVLLADQSLDARRSVDVGFAMAIESTPEQALTRSLKIAERIARLAPRALAATKWQLYRQLSESFAQAQDDTARLMSRALAAPDFADGVRGLIEHRAPVFDTSEVDALLRTEPPWLE